MSKTLENLMAAFAGESQANRKYLAYAQAADKEGLSGVAKVFRAAAAADGAADPAACRTVLVQQLLRCADECAGDCGQAACVPPVALGPLLAAAEACPQLCGALATALATVRCMHGAAHPLVRDAAAHAGPLLAARLAAFHAMLDAP